MAIARLSLGAVLMGCSILAAQVPDSQRVRVSDPQRLRELGFDTDAANVWERLEATAKAGAPQAPESWGTSLGYSTLVGYELHEEYFYHALRKAVADATCSYGAPLVPLNRNADAYFDVPDGVELLQFQFWSYDGVDEWLTVDLWETCQVVGFDPPVTTLLKTVETVGSAGQYFVAAPLGGLTASSQCAYSIRVWFTTDELGPCSAGDLKFQKTQLVWQRQVSPAPSTPTFADVPPSHPFYQFVEALSKSGITGGCGNGNFCPDSPLTRGQMAAFLSKALGLQWP